MKRTAHEIAADMNAAISKGDWNFLQSALLEAASMKLKVYQLMHNFPSGEAPQELSGEMERLKQEQNKHVVAQHYEEAAKVREKARAVEIKIARSKSASFFRNENYFNVLNENEIIYVLPDDEETGRNIFGAVQRYFTRDGAAF